MMEMVQDVDLGYTKVFSDLKLWKLLFPNSFVCYIFGCVRLTLTTALDVAPIACGGHIIIAPPAAIDLKDAIVGGTINVVVDRGGCVA